MKTILICPNQATGLPVLADSKPLHTLPILGEAFICYWMRHLAIEKLKEVRIVTTDPVEDLLKYTGDGSRWGLKIEVFREIRDLRPDEARKRYRPAYETDWAAEPFDVIEANHLPGLSAHKLFTSYESWFAAIVNWLPIMVRSKRVGLREVSPGVWLGRRTKLSRSATLIAPCWIGDHVQVGKDSVVGPNSFLEDQVVIDGGCSVQSSWVGPETFMGSLTELKESLAWGNLLINWKNGSHTFVPDPFLLTSVTETKGREEVAVTVCDTQVSTSPLARRIESVISLTQKLQS
jgi:NDP-sugar pyrophosphorylase family protein